jgi:vanillate O-demethylase monooxygenase subunit
MNDHPDHKFYNLNIDAGAMWARRLIDGLVAKEGAKKSVIRIVNIK